VNDRRGPCAASANEPTPRARPSRMPARRTLWRTPDVPQVCDGAAPLASPSAKSLIIPTVSPPVQSAAQGEHPRPGSCSRRICEAKDACEAALVQALAALRHSPKTWGLPGYISGERAHASYALIQGIGSKGPWPAASMGFTKREAGVVRVTCIVTRLSPWSRTGTIRSSWGSRAGFVLPFAM
jgi:hypothetical protein